VAAGDDPPFVGGGDPPAAFAFGAAFGLAFGTIAVAGGAFAALASAGLSAGLAFASKAGLSAVLETLTGLTGDLDRFFGLSFFGFLWWLSLLVEPLLDGRRRLNSLLEERRRRRESFLALCLLLFLRSEAELLVEELRLDLRTPCFDGMA